MSDRVCSWSVDEGVSMYAEERQHEILTRARGLGRVSVAELAMRFDVTPETIRRDLDALSGRGLLSRVHGGAVPAEKLRLAEASLDSRQTSFPEEKLAIARAAMGLLPRREGLTVILRRNAIIVFMSIELMLNATNLAFVGFARWHGNLDGLIAAFFVMVVAAAEVVVGLAIIFILVNIFSH